VHPAQTWSAISHCDLPQCTYGYGLILLLLLLLLQAFLSPSNLNIVMEYVPDGSLLSHIQEHR
jgi:hypothetical protein